MPITITQNPGQYNLAYGANAVTLSGLTTQNKYVLRIKNEAGDVISDVRQAPNVYGSAIFDIQNILQTYVGVGATDIDIIGSDGTNNWKFSTSLGTTYDIEWGTETGGIFTSAGTLEGLEAYPGRKEYYEIDWDYSKLSATISDIGGSTVTSVGAGLTDNGTIGTYTIDYEGSIIELKAYEHTIRLDDYSTVSYFQNVEFDSTVFPTGHGLNAITVIGFNESNQKLYEYTYQNILSNSGGPFTTPDDTAIPSYPYKIISFGSGPENLEGIPFNQTAYYYIIPRTWNDSNVGLFEQPTWYGHKYTIDRGICLDYDTIQFSWMNSYGTRDYYTFTKKNERSVEVKRDTYLKSAVNYNSTSFQVQQSDRGTTTYSQTLTQSYLANTDYISDADTRWLESLFVSPDVRVRFQGQDQFIPVTLTSKSYTEKTYRKDKLFQYEIRFQLAHGIKSQRG